MKSKISLIVLALAFSLSLIIAPPAAAQVVINEADADNPGTDALEFVELYDGGAGNTALDGLVVVFYNGSNDLSYAAFDLDGFRTDANGFFLMGNSGVTPAPSLVFANNFLQNGADAVAVYAGNAADFPNNTAVTTTNLIDAVVYGTDDADDPGLLILLNPGQPQVNENGGGSGTNHSNARVPNGGIPRNTVTYVQQPPTPGTTNVPTTTRQEIWAIQGKGLASPIAAQIVITENNVVTAVGPDGFFMQTPAARTDNDPETSDGIFVFTGSAPAVRAGDLVNVSGQVVEFSNFTEISGNPAVTVVSSGHALPAPVPFNTTTPSPNQPQPATELERYEGMLVEIAAGIVAGPNQFFSSDSVAELFVAATANRPFREPGIAFPGLPELPVWDGNPEIFELDPNRLGLPNALIPAGSTFSATGVLGFEFSGYELWPTQYKFTTVTLPRPVRARATAEVTIATLNVLRLFDDVDDPSIDEPVPSRAAYQGRLGKLSKYIREILRGPEILAIQEAENLKTLQDLSGRIKRDDAALDYAAHLFEGNDVGGIDVGFLVRRTIKVDSVVQMGKAEILTVDGTLLHDRPPLALHAELPDGRAMTVLNLHLRSLSSIADSVNGPRVRAKRHEQAKSVSLMAQSLQTAKPNLAVIGDFNAFQFTDGYVHVLGQIAGKPADATQALIPGTDNVNPDLINAIDSLTVEERYSFVFDGSAQVLDHVLVSQALQSTVSGIEYGRGNADAPESFATDTTTSRRCSDHDGLVLYLKLSPSHVAAGEDGITSAANYRLAPNYPNPFFAAGETEIRFALPAAAEVRLEIFNLLGARVALLVDDKILAGEHRVRWDGRAENGNQAAAGIYFYRLRAETKNSKWIAVKKMLLLP